MMVPFRKNGSQLSKQEYGAGVMMNYYKAAAIFLLVKFYLPDLTELPL